MWVRADNTYRFYYKKQAPGDGRQNRAPGGALGPPQGAPQMGPGAPGIDLQSKMKILKF